MGFSNSNERDKQKELTVSSAEQVDRRFSSKGEKSKSVTRSARGDKWKTNC